MDDLITLSSDVDDVQIVGIDMDFDSIEQAIWNHHNCTDHYTYNHFTLKTAQRDAFDLDMENTFDIVVSNGLNIYIKNDEEVINLYKSFNKSLKSNGLLLTSHLTPITDQVFHDENFSKASVILNDIIGVKWNNPRPVEMIVHQLDVAGFDILTIEFDTDQFYPTFLCKKR